jgi:predicted  nucleic acid-binding Zn-ribbon protein
MWKEILSLSQKTLTMSNDLDHLREEVNELRRTVRDLTLAIQRLSDQIEMNRQREKDEREKLALLLQIKFLEFEKRLPPAQSA